MQGASAPTTGRRRANMVTQLPEDSDASRTAIQHGFPDQQGVMTQQGMNSQQNLVTQQGLVTQDLDFSQLGADLTQAGFLTQVSHLGLLIVYRLSFGRDMGTRTRLIRSQHMIFNLSPSSIHK